MSDSIDGASAKYLRRYILVAIFLSGAAVLSIEIAGTRLISPFYGTSVWCWSALITVTLAALAVGYRLGGRRADRAPGPATFVNFLGAAAAAVALIPALRFPALKLSAHLGPMYGALAGAALLVAPALTLLSALGPAAIKLTASGKADVGGASGDIYAVSTLGSMAGALVTALALIPHVALPRLFYGISIVLLLLHAWGRSLIGRKTGIALTAAAAIVCCGAWPQPAAPSSQRLLKESLYGQIEVRDEDGERELLINNQHESSRLPERGASPYPGMEELATRFRPHAQRALVVGVGGGSLGTSLEANHGIATDNVEIDADVVSAAKEYFRFAPRGGIFIEDGRSYLERGGPLYDLMFIDAYKTDTVPYDLFTEEAFTAMHRRLQPNGILGINFLASTDPKGERAWVSVYKTLRGVFPEVRAFKLFKPEGRIKIYFLCSDRKFPSAIPLQAAPPWGRKELEYMLSHELNPTQAEVANAYRLTDDFTPLDILLVESSMLRRRAILAEIAARGDQ